MSLLIRMGRALGALTAVLFVLLGWPALLLAAVSGPLAGYLPDIGGAGLAVLTMDPGGLLLAVVLVGAAAAWSVTALALVVELVSQASGVRAPQLGRAFPQAGMSRLAGAALLILPASGVLVPGVAAAAPMHAGGHVDGSAAPISASQGGTQGDDLDCDPGKPDKPRYHRVQSGDTLWAIADEELGRGQRYPELFQASTGIRQPGGQRLTDPDVILPGWRIRVPSSGQAAEVCDPTPTAPEAPVPDLDRAPASQPGPTPTQDKATDLSGSARAGAQGAASGHAPDPTAGATQSADPTTASSASSDGLGVAGVHLVARTANSVRLGWDATPAAAWYWVQLGEQSIRVQTTEVVLQGLAPEVAKEVSVRAVAPDGRWGPAAQFDLGTAKSHASYSQESGSKPTRASAAALLALRPATRSAAQAMADSVDVAEALALVPTASSARRCQLALTRVVSARRIGAAAHRTDNRDVTRTAEVLATLRLGGPSSPEQLLADGAGPARRGAAITAMIDSYGV